ncbi:MAG: hypothetical protein IPO81_22420 [Kouleothrix sp.]|nr:hypothetical protein [Kouleothrix sp.]
MSLPLLTTKLHIPHTLVALVDPRLFEKLSWGLEHAARLMLASAIAPQAYGRDLSRPHSGTAKSRALNHV